MAEEQARTWSRGTSFTGLFKGGKLVESQWSRQHTMQNEAVTFIGPSKVRTICKGALTGYPVLASVGTRTGQKQTAGRPTRGKSPLYLETTQVLHEK